MGATSDGAIGQTALERLRSAGISERTIDRFFRSFFGGVFFDRTLGTDATRLDFLLRMFAEGFACVPSRGMGEIAAHMAAPRAWPSLRAESGLRAMNTFSIATSLG